MSSRLSKQLASRLFVFVKCLPLEFPNMLCIIIKHTWHDSPFVLLQLSARVYFNSGYISNSFIDFNVSCSYPTYIDFPFHMFRGLLNKYQLSNELLIKGLYLPLNCWVCAKLWNRYLYHVILRPLRLITLSVWCCFARNQSESLSRRHDRIIQILSEWN